MATKDKFKDKLKELEQRGWDLGAIENRVRELESNGFSQKSLERVKIQAERTEILDSIQLRAEEYNYIFKNCAQGTALALLEEFGLGNMQVIKGLTAFPGIGGTGEACGGVTGSLVAFGLFFGGDDILDISATGFAMMTAQKFMASFKDQMGSLHCSDIQEKVIFGRNMDPGASEENMKAFAEAKGFEKCGLCAGIGARIAAGFIIDGIS